MGSFPPPGKRTVCDRWKSWWRTSSSCSFSLSHFSSYTMEEATILSSQHTHNTYAHAYTLLAPLSSLSSSPEAAVSQPPRQLPSLSLSLSLPPSIRTRLPATTAVATREVQSTSVGDKAGKVCFDTKHSLTRLSNLQYSLSLSLHFCCWPYVFIRLNVIASH